MPVLLVLPPTGLRPFSDFMNAAFLPRRRPTWGSVVQIGLKRVENGSNTYSVATFKKLFDFEGEQLMQIKSYAEGFRSQIKLMLQERAVNTEARSETDEGLESDPHYLSTDSEGSFTITAANTINGDREALPL